MPDSPAPMSADEEAGRRWSPLERDFISKNGHLGARLIAQMTCRSVKSVKGYADRNRISLRPVGQMGGQRMLEVRHEGANDE